MVARVAGLVYGGRHRNRSNRVAMNNQLNEIEGLLRQRKYKIAEVKITKHLRTLVDHPQHQAELLILRARVKLLTSRPEGGLEDIAKASGVYPDIMAQPRAQEVKADCFFARYELSALGFAERSDWLMAERLYKAIIDHYPAYNNLGWIYYQFGRLLLSANQIERAVEAFHRALVSPSDVPALTSYAYERLGFTAFYEQRDFRQALTYLDKAVQTYPTSEDRAWLIQAHLLKGRILRDTHRLGEAVEAAKEALRLANQRGIAKASQLEAYLIAAEIFSRAPGQEVRVMEVLAQYFQRSKRPPGVDVTWSRAYEMLGDASFAAGLYERAVTAYLAVIQYNPYHPWEVSIYQRVAKAYYQQGLYETAIQAVQRALKSAKAEDQLPDADLYDILGSSHYALAQFEQAVAAFDQALVLAHPQDPITAKIARYRQYALDTIQQKVGS